MTLANTPSGHAPSRDELDRQLRDLFQGVAASRIRAQDEALLEAAIAAAETPSPLSAERRRTEAALGRGFPRAA